MRATEWPARFAVAGLILAAGPAVTADRADAAAPVRVTIEHKTLTVTGDATSQKIALRVRAQGQQLEIHAADDGSAEFKVNRNRFDRILVEAAGGDDAVRVDGGRGDDDAFLGAGDDRFTCDPGEGSHRVEARPGRTRWR